MSLSWLITFLNAERQAVSFVGVSPEPLTPEQALARSFDEVARRGGEMVNVIPCETHEGDDLVVLGAHRTPSSPLRRVDGE